MPEPGFTTVAKVVDVHDGDTIKVEVTRTFSVRIRDLLVAELNTEKGKQAAEFLRNRLMNSEILLFIPSNDPHKLMDINSFSRLIGDIWKDKIDIVDVMEENKMGRRIKKGEKPHEGE